MKISNCFLSLLASVIFYSCTSNNKQTRKDSVPVHISSSNISNSKQKELSLLIVDSLKKLMAIADTMHRSYGESDTIDHVSNLNNIISETLATILINPQITNQDMAKLLKCPNLGIVHSDDKRLWIFTWYENTGGSWKSNLSVVHYKTANGRSKVAFDDSGTMGGSENLFLSSGASFDIIYKLPAKNKDLYLCIGSGVGCNTCVYSNAVVVQLTRDSVNFHYHAFKKPDENDYTIGNQGSATFVLGAREGDLKEFNFDPKTKTLNYKYLTDDNTPIPNGESNNQRHITRKLIFNGVRFIGDPYN